MAHITITSSGTRYYIEIDENESGIYKLTNLGSKGPIDLLRQHERKIVGVLFVSDCEIRKHSVIAQELGIPAAHVTQWKHELQKKGRAMQDDKFVILQKKYGIDAILKGK